MQRATAAPAQAVVDLFLLFGDVNVHRALFVAGRQNFTDLLRGDRAQRVEAQTQRLRFLLSQQRSQARLQLQVVFGAVDKAALPIIGRLAAESGMAVQHRQQSQTDTAFARCLTDAQCQLGRIGIRLTVVVVVHIVEFSN